MSNLRDEIQSALNILQPWTTTGSGQHIDLEQLADQISAIAAAHILLKENELRTERAHADRWQKLAGHYDDIRGWLRICQDTPEGHAEFYRECCLLIFGEYERNDQ